MIRYILILVGVLFVYECKAELSGYQKYILSTAYEEGKSIGYPETVAGIIWHESGGGKKKCNLADPSFGVGHMKVGTARDIMKRDLGMEGFKDAEIVNILLNNDEFAILLTCLYVKRSIQLFKRTPGKYWSKAVLSYNCGVKGVLVNGLDNDPNEYVRKVNLAIKEVVRPFIKTKEEIDGKTDRYK